MRCRTGILAWVVAALALQPFAQAVRADDLPEYRLKAAVLYNFTLFTEWPAEVGGTLNMCVFGADPFGKELDALQGKATGGRIVAVHRKSAAESLTGCQIVFIAATAMGMLPRVLDELHGRPVLLVADSEGAARRGVALNLAVTNNKVSFSANLKAARAAGLNLSSNLLRLATEVIQ